MDDELTKQRVMGILFAVRPRRRGRSGLRCVLTIALYAAGIFFVAIDAPQAVAEVVITSFNSWPLP